MVFCDDDLPAKAWNIQDEVDEAFYGIGICGGVAGPLGIRLDDDNIRFI